jgi:hypothetical protein
MMGFARGSAAIDLDSEDAEGTENGTVGSAAIAGPAISRAAPPAKTTDYVFCGEMTSYLLLVRIYNRFIQSEQYLDYISGAAAALDNATKNGSWLYKIISRQCKLSEITG